jgi:hypothetical protein
MADQHSEQHKAVLDDLLLQIPGVTAKKMFGCPSYFIAGKAFVSVFGDGVAIKLPKDQMDAVLKRSDAKPFAPGGMPMGGWVLITHKNSADYRGELGLMNNAVEYVAEQAATAPPKKKAKGK